LISLFIVAKIQQLPEKLQKNKKRLDLFPEQW